MSSTEVQKNGTKPPELMLELKVAANPNGQAAAFVPVRWCVHKPLIEAVSDYHNPYVLITVRSVSTKDYGGGVTDEEYTDTNVYLAPLEAEMQFVAFRRPGRNQICAVVFDMFNSKSAKTARQLQKLAGYDSLFYEGEVYEPNDEDDEAKYINEERRRQRKTAPAFSGDHLRHLRESIMIVDVEVPSEMFAKEPAAWQRQMVGAYFDTKGADQCGFRKRFWFAALPLSFAAVPFFYAYKLVATVLMFFFGRWPNKNFYKTVANPLAFGKLIYRATRQCPWSFWWIKKDNNGNEEFRFWPLTFVNPPVLVLLPSLLFGIFSIPHRKSASHPWHPIVSLSWWQTVEWVDGIIIGVVLAACAVVLAGLGAGFIAALIVKYFPQVQLILVPFQRLSAARQRWSTGRHEARKARDEERKQRLEAALVAMTCRGEASIVDVSALPKEKQTVKLKFNDFKRKVCRPFAA